jgi:undecaprenyl diphosphate synthase
MSKSRGEESHVPRHVAIIMDGNGRWAAGKFLGRIRGHIAGVGAVRKVVRAASDAGVRYLTLFAFSSENWQRPKAEVEALMMLLERNLIAEAEELAREGVRVRVIGKLDGLPKGAANAVRRTEEITSGGRKMDLLLAISYGGRQEILDAVRKIAAEGVKPEEINEETFRQHLYAPDVPDPDLLIRTSGEMRISNFLLWQCAYTELYVTDVLWPDFDETEFKRALDVFASRERRFGKTSEQLTRD